MTDTSRAAWRTLTADELTAYICQLLGWKKHVYPQQRYAHNDWDGPDGTIHDGDLEDSPPDFGNDEKAALSLPIDDGQYWVLTPYPNGRKRAAIRSDRAYGDLVYEFADTYAEAMSRAWLAWKTER